MRPRIFFSCFLLLILVCVGCKSPATKSNPAQKKGTNSIMQSESAVPDELMQQFRIMISIRGETSREAFIRMMKKDLNEFETLQAGKDSLMNSVGLNSEPKFMRANSVRDDFSMRFYPYIYLSKTYRYFYISPMTTLSIDATGYVNVSIPMMVIYRCSTTGIETDTIQVFPVENCDYDYGNLIESDIREIDKIAYPVDDLNPNAKAQIVNLVLTSLKPNK